MKKKVLFQNLIISLLLVFFTLSALFAASTTPTPPQGKILFVDTTEEGKTYLATISPNGSGFVRLTPPYQNIVFPKISEKSGWIGFTNKLPDMGSEVYLLNKEGTKIKKIFDGVALEGFSPDGKFLLYTTCDQEAALFSYCLASKKSTKISDTLRITAADWSPQGDWIAVSALVEDGTNDLYIISTMAQGIIRLTQTDGINESFPQFTNDGKFLAFTSDRYGSNEIEFLDLEKKRFQRPLISGMFSALSPDNKWVVYESGSSIGVSQTDGLNKKELVRGRTPSWIK